MDGIYPPAEAALALYPRFLSLIYLVDFVSFHKSWVIIAKVFGDGREESRENGSFVFLLDIQPDLYLYIHT